MWGLLGQPTRSGYSYNYDAPDDTKKSSPQSDILTLPLIVVFTFLLPFILLIVVIVQLVSEALDSLKNRIESKEHHE